MALTAFKNGIFLFLSLFLLHQFTAVPLTAAAGRRPAVVEDVHRADFPADFVFGAATSAYQVEGAYKEDGKGLSIIDTFVHTHPEKIADKSTGDIADDSYHRYKEDIKLMKDLGIDAYRFSISWPRILPTGSLAGGINQKGVDFYNNFINLLIANGLKPYVTIFHWDLPQALEDKYGGFLSPKIVNDFRDYTDVLFKLFGDRVKHWITINEPMIFTLTGYVLGQLAPGRCSSFLGQCKKGNSATEPYIVGHHLLLSHAAAVEIYRKKYQASQKGKIGITLVASWLKPYSDSKEVADALARDLDFSLGWFMDPITQGDYPFIMRALVQDRLPRFSAKESSLLKGSFDFLGLNYYTTLFVKNVPFFASKNVSYLSDSHSSETGFRNGVPIGPPSATSTFFSYPQGLNDILHYIKNKYNDPIIYITENGMSEFNNASLPLKEALKDQKRIDFHRRHLFYLQKSIKEGVKVKGYFVWSLLDNFEWSSGYTVRFGLYFVDYKDKLKRYPKSSALWFQQFLKK